MNLTVHILPLFLLLGCALSHGLGAVVSLCKEDAQYANLASASAVQTKISLSLSMDPDDPYSYSLTYSRVLASNL